MRLTRSKLVGLAVMVVAVLPNLAFATNGYRQIGYGVKSKGMAGVGIALPQDAFAAAMNPAGTAYVCDRFDIGVHYLRHRGDALLQADLEDYLGCKKSAFTQVFLTTHKELFWPEAAITWNYCPCCSVGLAIYAFGGWNTEFGEKTFLGGFDLHDHDLQGSSNSVEVEFEGRPLGCDYQVYFITPSWACQLCGCHTLGVSANVAVAALNLSGVEFFGEKRKQSWAPFYVSDKGTEYESGIGFKFGWIGQFDCGITVGATYQTKTWMNHFKKYRGFIPEDGNVDLPSIWGLGVTWCVWPCVVLSADVERIMWTDTKWFRHDFRNVGKFGTKSGKGLGWEDQTVVKIGAAWDVWECLTLRAGFNYGTTLYAGRDLFLNVLTLETIKHHFTVGATYYHGCHELSIDYVHGDRHNLEWTANPLSEERPFIFDDLAARNRCEQDSVGLSYGYRF